MLLYSVIVPNNFKLLGFVRLVLTVFLLKLCGFYNKFYFKIVCFLSEKAVWFINIVDFSTEIWILKFLETRTSLKKMSFCIVVLRTESSAKPPRQNFYKTSILGQIRCTQILIIPKINLIFLPKNLFLDSYKVCQKQGSVSKLEFKVHTTKLQWAFSHKNDGYRFRGLA